MPNPDKDQKIQEMIAVLRRIDQEMLDDVTRQLAKIETEMDALRERRRHGEDVEAEMRELSGRKEPLLDAEDGLRVPRDGALIERMSDTERYADLVEYEQLVKRDIESLREGNTQGQNDDKIRELTVRIVELAMLKEFFYKEMGEMSGEHSLR